MQLVNQGTRSGRPLHREMSESPDLTRQTSITDGGARTISRHTSPGRDLLFLLLLFVIEGLVIYGIQKFLFPLEDYWITIWLGVIVYGLIEWLLIRRRHTKNVFIALDQGNLQLRDTILLALGPLIISAVLALTGNGQLIFLLPALWVICILHTCVSALAVYFLDYFKNRDRFTLTARNKAWLAGIFFVLFIYGLGFLSLQIYKPIHPLLRGDPVTRGIWFTIPVEKSSLFPFGYARLEDGVFDDLGHPFIASLAQTLGLIPPCDNPGPDTARSVPTPDPGTLVQPRFAYSVNTLCPKWTKTLPGFYWRVGLAGIFLLSLIIGIFIFNNPADLAMISLVMLVAWETWPASARERMGNVAVLVAGMAFVMLILPLMRRSRYSILVAWGLLSGLLFGLAGFVRQPAGFALMVTSLMIVIFAGIKYRKAALALTALGALLVGNSLIPATVNGLFLYRDEKLQITAPSISPRAHGSGIALLGGVGGKWLESPASYEYENSLDMGFLDASIWFQVYNENPMVSFTQNSYEMMQLTARQIFFRYVVHHPMEFISISLQKVYNTFILMLQVPKNWPEVSLLLFTLLCLRFIFYRQKSSYPDSANSKVIEIVAVFAILTAIAALPAVVTTPDYGQSTFLPAAVMFFTAVIVVYYAVQSLFFKIGK
jgi:hypothetical protein